MKIITKWQSAIGVLSLGLLLGFRVMTVMAADPGGVSPTSEPLPTQIPVPTIDDSAPLSGPSARLRAPVHLNKPILPEIGGRSPVTVELQNKDANSVTVKLVNHDGQEMTAPAAVSQQNNLTEITVTPPPQFEPGKYQLLITDSTGAQVKEDFLWGVLAINPDKAAYLPGDTAELSMAVLDETGNMVCDAALKLTITNLSAGTTAILSTDNEEIKVNPECEEHRMTLKPDYEASYLVGAPGKYQMDLTATTKNGSYTVTDNLTAAESLNFGLKRVSATRIYPPNNYPMELTLETNQDFNGYAYETIPRSFALMPAKESETGFELVATEKNDQVIRWKVKAKQGDTVNLAYQFKAPQISPQFYLLGPVQLVDMGGNVVYAEPRQWQIAADAAGSQIRQEINLIDGQVTAAGVDSALTNLDTSRYSGTVTYYFEVVAKVASGTLTVNLRTGSTDVVGIGVSTTSFVRLRTVFTPAVGSNDYQLNLVNGTTPVVQAARIIILQNASTIRATETQIEIGNREIGTSFGTTSPQISPKYWTYNSANWDAGTTFYADVTYLQSPSVAAGSTLFQTPGTFYWQAPTGITGVSVELWGGGGGGGGAYTTNGKGGGGAGGQYVMDMNNPVTPGTTYPVVVAAYTVGSTGNGYNGNDTTWRTNVAVAKGGQGGTRTAAGGVPAGGTGSTTSGVGDTVYAGGNGAVGTTGSAAGGAGGGGAGSQGAGLAGSGGTAGVGTSDYGGAGGAGLSSRGVGNSGLAYGGGGGGAMKSNNSNYVGGAGGQGMARITWPAANYATTIILQEDNGSFASWSNLVTIVNAGVGTSATRVRSAAFTPTNGRHYRLVSMIAGGGTMNIYNAKIVADQGSSPQSLPVYDTGSSASTPSDTSVLSWTHTQTGGSDTVMIVGVGTRSNRSVTSVTYGSCSLSFKGEYNTALDVRSELWYVVGCGVTSGTVTVNIGASTTVAAGAVSYTNADTVNFDIGGTATGQTTSVSSQVTSNIVSKVVDVVAVQSANNSLSPTAGQTERVHKVGTAIGLSMGELTGSSVATMSWSFTSDYAAQTVMSISNSTGGSTSSTVTHLEPQYLLVNTKTTAVGSTSNYQDLWDSTEWNNVSNLYYLAQDAIGSSASVYLVDRDNSNALVTTGSQIPKGANEQIGTSFAMPTTGHQLDIGVSNAGTEVDAGKVIVATNITGPTSMNISGFCRQADLISNCAIGETVRYAVGGNLNAATTTIGSSGVWTFSGQTVPSNNSIVTFYVTGVGASQRANTVTRYVGSGSDLTSVYLFEKYLTIGDSADVVSVGNTDLNSYDNAVAGAGSSDVFFNVDTGGTLVVDALNQFGSVGLFVVGGNEFRPGSSGNNNVLANNMRIDGTLTADANTMTTTGSWTDNGLFSGNSGSVILSTGATAVITVGSTAVNFNNLSITAPGKVVQFQAGVGGSPVVNIGGTMTVTGVGGTLIYIQSTSSSQWLPKFTLTQLNITYANISNSGCAAGSSNVTLDSTSVNGGNNGACWVFPVTGPTMDQVMRHGEWFNNGVRQPFSW